jgi:hypothetical protein
LAGDNFGPGYSTFIWVVAIVFVLVVGAISAASFVVVWRRTRGTTRSNFSLLLAAGVLVVSALVLYLLLVRWPGSYMDFTWWISQPGFDEGTCSLTYQQQNLQRQNANGIAFLLSIAGGVLWLRVIIAARNRRRDTGSPVPGVK